MVQKGYNGNEWVNMVLCKAVKDYLKEGGTTNIEIDDFLDFYSWLSKGKKKCTVRVLQPLGKTSSSSPNSVQEI